MSHYKVEVIHYYQYIDEDISNVRLFYLGSASVECPCDCSKSDKNHSQTMFRLSEHQVVWKRFEIALSRWCPCSHKSLILRTREQWQQLKQKSELNLKDKAQ